MTSSAQGRDRPNMPCIPLLMIAYHFPPESVIGAARPFRFYKFAPRFGFQPIVVTAAPQGQDAPPDVKFIPDPFTTARSSLAWQVERGLRKFFIPGELGTLWSRAAGRYCRDEITRRNRPVALYSTFPPLGTHLAALQVANAFPGVPWIADFRDPYVTEASRALRGVRAAAAQWLERKMIERADLIIANTNEAGAEWKTRYPAAAGKVEVIPNGFDPSDELLAPVLSPHETKTLLHTGSLYAGRHAAPVLASLDRLIRSSSLPPQAVRIRLVGPCVEGALIPVDAVESGLRRGWLEVARDPVPQSEAVAMAQDADGLFLIQPQSGTQVPGKLFEYIRIGRPILAFIQPGSPIEQILLGCGIPNVCVYPEDTPPGVDGKLLRFLEFSAGPWTPSRWFEQTFNAIEQTRTLCTLIDRALARKGVTPPPVEAHR